MLDQVIENFDLTEREAKVYLAGLKRGKSKVSDIAKEAGLNRITTYEILKRLATKGLAGGFTYDKYTYFQVIDPDTLILKKTRQLDLAKNLLPELLSIKNSERNKPKINFYSGVAGIKTIYEDTLNSKVKMIYSITNTKNLEEALGREYLNSYFKKRISKKIGVKVLVPDILESRNYLKRNKEDLREMKMFDPTKSDIPNEIMIYGNKIALLSFSGKIGVVIEDKEIATSMYSVWEIMWSLL
jgi:sugar-specific transcriptional regulator TrmB